MPDYQQMYYRLFHAAEQAIETLISAQKDCEELYCTAPEPQIMLLPQEEGQTINNGAGEG